MMEAVLSNADHPEYGVATIPLPIPRNQYDHCVALLEALEIGGASEADCRLDSLDSACPVLNRLVCTKVNLDELDYSAVDSREYETVRLRRVFSGRQPMTALDAELLQSSVSAIHCHNDGSLNIKLKNGQVIGKE